MAQKDILVWLVNQRRARPKEVFTITEISKGSCMSVANCHKAVHQLVRYGELEEVYARDCKKSFYRISNVAFEKVTGLLLEELTV